jgi:hypothetical protein
LSGIDNGRSFTRVHKDRQPDNRTFIQLLFWAETQMSLNSVSTIGIHKGITTYIHKDTLMTLTNHNQHHNSLLLGHSILIGTEVGEHASRFEPSMRHFVEAPAGPLIGVEDEKMVCVSSGDDHTLATNKDGQIFSIGLGLDGATGHGRVYDGSPTQFQIKNYAYTSKPCRLIESISKEFITSVAAGAHHSLALTREGKVYSFGTNDCGQLGHKPDSSFVFKDIYTDPKLIQNLQNIKCIAAGESHSIALGVNGRVFSFGSSLFGQCGRGVKIKRPYYDYKPYLIDSLYAICAVSTTFRHTLFLSFTGYVFACGTNDFGELGTTPTPTVLPYHDFETDSIPLRVDTRIKRIVYNEQDPEPWLYPNPKPAEKESQICAYVSMIIAGTSRSGFVARSMWQLDLKVDVLCTFGRDTPETQNFSLEEYRCGAGGCGREGGGGSGGTYNIYSIRW